MIHHTELIRELVRKGAFKGGKKFNGKGPVVYHDSCYLGRYNDLYETPRDIARFVPGVKLVEAERNRRTVFAAVRWRSHVDGRKYRQKDQLGAV